MLAEASRPAVQSVLTERAQSFPMRKFGWWGAGHTTPTAWPILRMEVNVLGRVGARSPRQTGPSGCMTQWPGIRAFWLHLYSSCLAISPWLW